MSSQRAHGRELIEHMVRPGLDNQMFRRWKKFYLPTRARMMIGNNKYFHSWFSNNDGVSDEQRDRDAAEENETSKDPDSDVTS